MYSKFIVNQNQQESGTVYEDEREREVKADVVRNQEEENVLRKQRQILFCTETVENA